MYQFDNTLVYGRLSARVEHDGGVLCRLLDLFAARGVSPLAVQYDLDRRTQSASLPPVARLRVDAEMGAHDWDVLCARARQAVGVLHIEADSCALLEEDAQQAA